MVVENQTAPLKGLVRTAGETSEAIHLLILELQNVGVGSDQRHEVAVVLRGSAQELKLRIVLLPLAEGQQEVLAVLSSVLSSVLDHGHFSLGDPLGELGDVLLRIWFLQLGEDLFEKALLLPARLLLHHCRLAARLGLLLGLLSDPLD